MFWSIFLCMLPILTIIGGIYFVLTCREEGGIPLIVIGVVACCFFFATILSSRIGTKANVYRYEAMQTTLDSQRENFKIRDGFENATITLEMVKMNKWLAGARYKAKIFNFWYPKELYDIKPIK